jgi:hypothetical protein
MSAGRLLLDLAHPLVISIAHGDQQLDARHQQPVATALPAPSWRRD